jgi:hypothetical protein
VTEGFSAEGSAATNARSHWLDIPETFSHAAANGQLMTMSQTAHKTTKAATRQTRSTISSEIAVKNKHTSTWPGSVTWTARRVKKERGPQTTISLCAAKTVSVSGAKQSHYPPKATLPAGGASWPSSPDRQDGRLNHSSLLAVMEHQRFPEQVNDGSRSAPVAFNLSVVLTGKGIGCYSTR